MLVTPKVEKRFPVRGPTKGQGNLLLLLLAGNLLVQLWNARGITAADSITPNGEWSSYTFFMWMLEITKWAGIVAGAAFLAGLIFFAVYFWWGQRQLGRLSHPMD